MVTLGNCLEYMEHFLWIRTKDGDVVPLRLNHAQLRLYETVRKLYQEGKPIRIIILKARQLGFSTVTEAMIFHRTATKENVQSLIIAHREDSTANLFAMSRLFYEMLPEPLRPMLAASNAQELLFKNPDKNLRRAESNPGLRSRIRCNTAKGGGVGRSDTLQNVHASEYAFWGKQKAEIFTGIAQAVPALPGTMIIIESTPNGFDDFKKKWDDAVSGESDYVPLFFAWFENPEYQRPVPPETEWTAEELTLADRYELTPEQLSWRRWCIRNNCNNNLDIFKQEYPSCPEEAFLTSGRGVFDNSAVIEQKQRAKKPIMVGEFFYDYDGLSITNIRFVEKSNGSVKLFELPEKRTPYVVGGDTAGEGSDWFSGFCIDNTTSNIVATLRKQYGEGEYARQMYCLGIYYNTALLGVETNFSTFPTQELRRLSYPKLYVRERPDTYTGAIQQSFGFVTSSKTRPTALAYMVELFTQHPECFRDDSLFDEMLTFAYNEDGRPEALDGEHDDMVMGCAITYAIRKQQRFTKRELKYSKKGWTKSMLEDYRHANEAEKERLLQEWGHLED